jgi:hypothetical protein
LDIIEGKPHVGDPGLLTALSDLVRRLCEFVSPCKRSSF